MKLTRLMSWGMLLVFLAAAVFPISVQAEGETPQYATIHDDTFIFLPLVIGTEEPVITYPTDMIIVDHRSIALFDSIPDQYIQAAIQLDSLFRHASVGGNINQGLDCLMNRTQPRPNYCDSGLSPSEIFYDPKYDRTNWDFEFHQPPPRQNPGWWNKVTLFIDRVDGLPANSYDVVAFKFGYVDAITGSLVDDAFFARNPNDPYPGIEDLEALQTRHPNKVVVHWTLGLARAVGTVDSTNFNTQLRAYASQNRVPLMDIADIQSYSPNGTPCTDVEGRGLPALCADYTTEQVGGHLNARGTQRMAKAYWILMAQLAGWQP